MSAENCIDTTRCPCPCLPKVTLEQAVEERAATIPARRYGTSAEFGAMCAFLCSQHAGFIVGQNILLDGGAMNATL